QREFALGGHFQLTRSVDGLEQEAFFALLKGNRRPAIAALEERFPTGELQAAPRFLAAVTSSTVGLEEGTDLGLEELGSFGRRRPILSKDQRRNAQGRKKDEHRSPNAKKKRSLRDSSFVIRPSILRH